MKLESIITDNFDRCYVCASRGNIHLHHIFFGVANRKLSGKYKLIIPLCYEHHEGTNGVHGINGNELNRSLKRLAQKKFKEYYPELDFIKIFGKEEKE